MGPGGPERELEAPRVVPPISFDALAGDGVTIWGDKKMGVSLGFRGTVNDDRSLQLPQFGSRLRDLIFGEKKPKKSPLREFTEGVDDPDYDPDNPPPNVERVHLPTAGRLGGEIKKVIEEMTGKMDPKVEVVDVSVIHDEIRVNFRIPDPKPKIVIEFEVPPEQPT